MKRRWAWVWTLTYTDTDTNTNITWYGTCPVWAAQPVPEGAVLTKHRMQVVGAKVQQCTVPGCTGSHFVLPKPTEPDTEGVAA